MVEAKLIETKQTVSQQVDDKVRDMKDDLSESLEIEKRKTNLIFHFVKETDGVGDRDYIEEVLKDGLQMDADRNITEISMVGKYVKDKVQPVRVKINFHEGNIEILAESKDVSRYSVIQEGLYCT